MAQTYSVGITTFIFNSDFSGDVVIRDGDRELNVPVTDLVGFVAEYVRRTKISQLEDASDADVLGIADEK